jgi:hypothetical protein
MSWATRAHRDRETSPEKAPRRDHQAVGARRSRRLWNPWLRACGAIGAFGTWNHPSRVLRRLQLLLPGSVPVPLLPRATMFSRRKVYSQRASSRASILLRVEWQ